MNQQEACSEYIKLLKHHEPDLTAELLAMARESFQEGWQQHERNNPSPWKGAE